MPAVIPAIPKLQFSDILGYSLPGGKLYTYLSGSTTPHNTWQDAGQVTLNANPIVLDSAGECVVFLDPAVAYTFVLKDSVNVQRWSQDHIDGVLGTATGIQPGTITTNMIADGAITSDKLSASLIATIDSIGAGLQYKNRVINAEMTVSQRHGAGDITLPSDGTPVVTMDLWNAQLSVDGGVARRVFMGVDTAPFYALEVGNIGDASGTVSVYQNIEPNNMRDLSFNNSGQVVLSAFFETFSYPQTITWQIAAPSDPDFSTLTAIQTGVFSPQLTADGQRLSVALDISDPAYRDGIQILFSATLASTGVFRVTGVQLESGIAVTPFAYGRPYPLELAICQYYYKPPFQSYEVGGVSFTVPDGVSRIYLTAAGGGAGGGSGNTAPEAGGGGGGGEFCIQYPFDVLPGQVLTGTVGIGGAGGTAGGDGSAGTATTFSTLTLDPGQGGKGSSNSSLGGAGGNSSTAHVFPGGEGSASFGGSVSGSGGSSLFSGACFAAAGTTLPGGARNGITAQTGGGGGSGALTTGTGGAGGNGIIIIKW